MVLVFDHLLGRRPSTKSQRHKAMNQSLKVVRECFKQMPGDANRLIHPRLELEREKQRAWREKSAKAGKASGKARREKKLDAEPTSNQRSKGVEPQASSSSLSLSFVCN